MNQPVVFRIDQSPERNRLSTLFRWILIIPHAIVLGLWALVAFLASIAAWFAIVFTGRYPRGLWNFNVGYVIYATRLQAYMHLAADPFPPFGSGGEYPVYVGIVYQEQYDRLKTGLRFLYVLPAYIIDAVLLYVALAASFFSWIVIIITGRQPQWLQDLLVYAVGWTVRYTSLAMLVSETYELEEGPPLPTGAMAAV
jgi:hypothetical protein